MIGDDLTINQLQARLASLLEVWERERDHRSVFLAWYALATDSVHEAICADRFGDPLWVLRLLSRLADHYFVTVQTDRDDRSLVTPAAWRAAHDSPPRGVRRCTAEWLVLGVNAQLSNDLPQAIASALRDDWPHRGPLRAMRRADVEIFADLIAETVQCACDALNAWHRRDGELHLAARAWVLDAWNTAMPLVTAGDEHWWAAIVEEIECSAARRAHLLACAIAGRRELLTLGARGLDRRFPVHHDERTCSLRDPVPTWGTRSPVQFEPFGA